MYMYASDEGNAAGVMTQTNTLKIMGKNVTEILESAGQSIRDKCSQTTVASGGETP